MEKKIRALLEWYIKYGEKPDTISEIVKDERLIGEFASLRLILNKVSTIPHYWHYQLLKDTELLQQGIIETTMTKQKDLVTGNDLMQFSGKTTKSSTRKAPSKTKIKPKKSKK